MVTRLLVLVLALCTSLGASRAAEPDARLELLFQTPHPIVGQMIFATFRAEYTYGIGRESLQMPPFTGFNWVQLERDKWTEQTVGDRRLKVLERRLALFAKAPGHFTFAPFVHRVSVVEQNNRWVDKVFTSGPTTIDIAPAPAVAGQAWMPASSVELTDDWSRDPAGLTDGVNTRRTITLKILGADPERLPAAPVIREPWLISFVAPEERHIEPTPNGPLATLTWSWQLRPITGEVGTLPAVVFPWYDVASGEAREAALGPRRIGDARFGNNTTTVWTDYFSPAWSLVLAGIVGLLLALIALASLVRPLTPAERDLFRRRLRRLLPDRDASLLKAAARRGDLPTARQAAARWLSRQQTPTARRRDLLAPIDSALFSPQPQTKGFDARAFARRVLREA
ncbi:hypothetical protein [Oryzibacter oryziterrae]|uniref:hypothetical protein n=1 Tax=Oryzibacter oryziterrae TaxID=2766474 RepID=UPI001F48E54B|nr:hypothetical protein [Oryzibacter oryziterrae]